MTGVRGTAERLPRGLPVGALVAVMVLTWPGWAGAQGSDGHGGEVPDVELGEREEGGDVHSEVGVDGDAGEQPEAVTPIGPGGGVELLWTGLPVVNLDGPDGEPCLDYNWVGYATEEEVEAAQADAQQAISYLYANVPDLQGNQPEQDCPVDPAESLPPQMLREAVRQAFVDRMPPIEPEIAPGYALTGMLAYLDTGGEHSLEYGPVEHDLDLGVIDLTVRVEGRGETTVDWGDERRDLVTYEVSGRPFPDGEVRHAYADRGEVDIVIVDSWTLTFDVLGYPIVESVSFETDPVVMEGFEVRELRSHRVAPE